MNLHKILNFILNIGLLAILFIPFVISETQLFPFISGKGFDFRILVELLGAVWLIGMFYDSSLRPKASWITTSVLVFGGVVIAADLFGVSPYKSFWSNFERMDGLVSLLHLFAYFFIAGAVLNTRSRWKLFFNTSVLSSVAMSCYAFLQLAGKITINQGGVRIDGTFGNATYLAVFMLFNFFITLLLMAWMQRDQRSTMKPLWYAWYSLALIFQLISLYHTATRGAILGLVGGLVLTALIVAIFGKKESSFSNARKISVGVLIAMLLVTGGFFAIRKTQFVLTSPTLSRFSSLSVNEINKQGRRYVWPMAVKGFMEKPILGWGQENFNYVFNKYYDPRMYNQEPWFDRAHNIVLDWLVAGGALGLLSYLGMFAALLYLLWKNNSLSLVEKSIIVGLTAAYFFQNLFVFDNLISYVYFFSLLAFVHAESVQGKAEPRWLSRFSENDLVARKALPVVVVILTIFALYSLNIKPIQANKTLIKGLSFNVMTVDQSIGHFKKVFEYKTFADTEATEQLLNQFGNFMGKSATAESKQAYTMLAVEKMDQQVNRFPNDARSLLFMGSMRNRLGDPANALPYLERAQKQSPQKQTILIEIGLSHLSLGDYPHALEKFKAAYDLAPENAEAKILYAIGAIYSKDTVLTKRLLAELGQDAAATDDRLISALAGTNQVAEAVKLIERRVTLQPENPEIRFRLSAGYLALGQRAKSVQILQEVVKLFPEFKERTEYYIKEIQAGRNP